MIIYVDLEHQRLAGQEPEAWEKSLARRLKHKYRFEAMSGLPCLIIRYDRLTLALLNDLRPVVRAIIISGCYTDYEHYSEESLAGLRAVYQAAAWPVLGLCAGSQLLAQTYGAPIGSIGTLPPAAPDTFIGEAVPGLKYEQGFMPIQVQTAHPLFDGLSAQPLVFQSHYWEIKAPPPGFQVLAASALCPIQAIAHLERPLFGVQFHPEEYDAAHPDGRRVIENFFKLVGAGPAAPAYPDLAETPLGRAFGIVGDEVEESV